MEIKTAPDSVADIAKLSLGSDSRDGKRVKTVVRKKEGKLQPKPANKPLLSLHNSSEFTSKFSKDIELSPIRDFKTTGEKMAKMLVEENKKKIMEKGKDVTLKPQPDPLCGLENAEIMMDSQLNIPYECFMTKVDLKYGLYDFYKMQLIRQPNDKEMIILFTQWGRMDTSGDFQKIPFATEKEAIDEFEKIFHSKTGNAWENFHNFIPNPSKYRLIKKDLRLLKYITEAKLDFDELEKAAKVSSTTLPKSIIDLIRTLSVVHRETGSSSSSSSQENADHNTLQFLQLDTLLRGEKLLKTLVNRNQKKDKIDKDKSGKYKEKYKKEVWNDIVKFSEEFYSIIPVFGYSTEKLEPIFREHDLRQKLIDISNILHLGLAKTILLAAQFHKSNIHPFEYIYRCLGTKIQILDRSNSIDKDEADLILQYINNTCDNVKVHEIYRVDIPSQDSRLNATNIQNRQLLWHGTSTDNMLSILKHGLRVAPITAHIRDALFGKGVYLADMFTKGQHYCKSGENGECKKYMLLVEAALGRICEAKVYDANEFTLPAGYDCIKTSDSKYQPDPESTLTWKGRTVALGTKKEKVLDSGIWGLDYNEYIIFNVKQVAIRYVVEFEDW